MRTLPFLLPLIGHGALIAFTVFLFIGPFHLLALPLDAVPILVFDAGLCLLFFLQHSLMIRKKARERIARRIPKRWFGALYAMVSAGILLLLVLAWQESPWRIASAEGGVRWLLQGIFLLAVIGQLWLSRSLEKTLDVFGEKALRRDPSEAPPPPPPLLTTGLYAWVRHPAYFTIVVLFWSYPNLTADRLLLNVLFTVWIIIGAFLEERDLVAIRGEEYRAYQRATPMLIPYRLPASVRRKQTP
uniref:Protein-S-isoprenylcysteine O-methyltransferase Ste14 n=1 Tax=Candidatus Kentrum sp. DK TaxID=2126562 RepID=A0A450SE69_9GAMM|nr:MAG: Protein-S-isoprenylcysteine O-methyltransferase Ste14 [Candidatus Kentron sp. DK]